MEAKPQGGHSWPHWFGGKHQDISIRVNGKCQWTCYWSLSWWTVDGNQKSGKLTSFWLVGYSPSFTNQPRWLGLGISEPSTVWPPQGAPSAAKTAAAALAAASAARKAQRKRKGKRAWEILLGFIYPFAILHPVSTEPMMFSTSLTFGVFGRFSRKKTWYHATFMSAGWWQLKHFLCSPLFWGRFPIRLIFFKGVEITNQSVFLGLRKHWPSNPNTPCRIGCQKNLQIQWKGGLGGLLPVSGRERLSES